MKKTLPILLLALGMGVSAASAQITKVGTVDMKRVFEAYYKTKEAESKINDARGAAKKELEDRQDLFNKGIAEVKKLEEDLGKPELSKENKEQKMKQRDEKISELKSMEREINEFRTTREKQLQEQSVRMRGGIVDEINKVVGDKVKSANYQLVFDKSGPSLNGVPVLMFARDEYDFTNDVISALNKGSKEPAAPAPATPAATPKLR